MSGCFLATKWEVFYQDDNIDSIEEVITGYIHFCIDTVVPKKTIKFYSNNKEYITPETKHCISFKNNNTMEFKEIQKELRIKLNLKINLLKLMNLIIFINGLIWL